MRKYSVVCALEEPPRGKPVILCGDIENVARAASSLGFGALELELRDADKLDLAQIKRALSRELVACSAISTDMEYEDNAVSMIETNYIQRRQAIEKLKPHIDLAAGLGCPVMIGSVRGMIPPRADDYEIDQYIGNFSDALCDLCEYAHAQDTRVLLRALPRYVSNYLNTAAETLAFAQGLSLPNLGVALDTHCMLMEEAGVERTLMMNGARIEYMRLSDSNLLCPGCGNVNFPAVLRALDDSGFDGYMSVAALPYPGGMECAKRALAYMRALDETRQCAR